MRVVLLRAHDGLAHHRIAHPAVDAHDDRLLHLVARHAADQLALILDGCGGCRLVHLADFSFMMVRTRAMSWRTFLSWLVLLSCWVASCMRRPNWARSSASSSFCSSTGSLPRSSLAFIVSLRASVARRWCGKAASPRRG